MKMPKQSRISQTKLRKEPETPFSLRPKLWTSPVDFGFVLIVLIGLVCPVESSESWQSPQSQLRGVG